MWYGSLPRIYNEVVTEDISVKGAIYGAFFLLSFNPEISASQIVMFCHIYRSSRKVDTYLYLTDKDDFSIVPEALMTIFGEPEYSFGFNLKPDRKLAREDTEVALKNLDEQGYHLQLQKDVLVEQMLALKGVN